MNKQRLIGLAKGIAAFSLLAGTIGTASGVGAQVQTQAAPGSVYVLTNQTAGNRVLVYDRSADGTLTANGSVATDGLGTGGGLGSQGALALGRGSRFLFAVNAGSNEISSFRVGAGGLQLAGKVSSGGTRPISLTSHNNLLYVLNAGGTGNITGFTVDTDGSLAPIAGSTRSLSSGAAGPAQVQFNGQGNVLVVTEKATNKIDTYTVGPDGLATGPNVQTTAGVTPFGFAFGLRGNLIVSEAFGGAAGASAVSSYNLSKTGDLATVTGSAATHQTAACWVAVTNNGLYAYTTNAGSGSISGYSIGPDGSLTLLNADGRTGDTGAGSSPIDVTVDISSHYLYALTAAAHGISAFAIEAGGSLTPVQSVAGLPVGAVGIVSR